MYAELCTFDTLHKTISCIGPGLYAPATFSLIHRSAWKENSAKFISKILHSPSPIGR